MASSPASFERRPGRRPLDGEHHQLREGGRFGEGARAKFRLLGEGAELVGITALPIRTS
jgi:hypothetical protein